MSIQVTVIEPKSSWQIIDLKEVWRFRGLMTAFLIRDLKLRYKQTVFGVLWAILQPLTTMVIFSFFFGKLANIPSDGVPYPVFSFAGLLLWTYFSTGLSLSSNSMISNANLITKVYFPRVIIPLTSTLTGLVDYVVSASIMIGLLIYFKIAITSMILLLPFLLFLTWLLTAGLGLVLTSINVKYRDVRYVLPFFIQTLLYVTPVIYPASVAERFRLLLLLNPMTGIIETHRAVWLGLPIPYDGLLISTFITIGIVVIGLFYFRNTEREFADLI